MHEVVVGEDSPRWMSGEINEDSTGEVDVLCTRTGSRQKNRTSAIPSSEIDQLEETD